MENSKTISMADLYSKKNTKLFTIILTVLITVVVTLASVSIYNKYTENSAPNDAQVVTLQEVVIAYAPELKRIIFLDRKSGQVQFSLSDSVSMAIFALKSSEVVTDYSSSLTNKK